MHGFPIRGFWISAALAVAASVAGAQQPTGGIIGSVADPSSGVVVSATKGASKIEATFQVGRENAAPFARELVTLAPGAERGEGTLTVSTGFAIKRTAAKIPGGLGAFWELDLQNEESGILRDVVLSAGDISIRPAAPDTRRVVFAVPRSVRLPCQVSFRLEFFKRSETFHFNIAGDGKASFLGADTPDAAAADRPAARDPKLPRRDQPRDAMSDAPASGSSKPAPRVVPARLAAPAGWDARRGTWLTAAAIKDRPQDLGGLWVDADAEEQPELVWFESAPQRLRVGSLANRGRAYGVDVTPLGSGRWTGQVFTCPRPKGTCPNLCRWVPGELAVDADDLHASGRWNGTQTKNDCSGYTTAPDQGPLQYRRFVGVSFLPVAPGRYLYLIGAPAVGPQRAQFKAAVRIGTSYANTSAAETRVRSSGGGAVTLTDKQRGIYDFVADRSGVYELEFALVGSDGLVFHTDRVRVEIPAIPGLGS